MLLNIIGNFQKKKKKTPTLVWALLKFTIFEIKTEIFKIQESQAHILQAVTSHVASGTLHRRE